MLTTRFLQLQQLHNSEQSQPRETQPQYIFWHMVSAHLQGYVETTIRGASFAWNFEIFN